MRLVRIQPKDKSTQPPTSAFRAESRPSRFVVVRDGYRVSDKEYSSPSDLEAIAEAEFWDLVATRHSWGERVDIVEYDNKYHRVW